MILFIYLFDMHLVQNIKNNSLKQGVGKCYIGPVGQPTGSIDQLYIGPVGHEARS